MDIFTELVSWAKANAKDGANVAVFEELVSKAALNKEYDRAIKKYEDERLPEKEKVMREAIRKELNPDESPEQKQIRELREKLEAKERAETIANRQNALRAKAKEFGVDPEIAADYAQYGDDAENVLKRHAEWHKKELDAVKAETARTAFGNKTPTSGGSLNSKPQAEFFKLTPKERAEFMAAGGVLTD